MDKAIIESYQQTDNKQYHAWKVCQVISGHCLFWINNEISKNEASNKKNSQPVFSQIDYRKIHKVFHSTNDTYSLLFILLLVLALGRS